MPTLNRQMAVRGPRFFEEGGKLMFVQHFDSSTRVGPRVATAEDKREHAEALAKFKAGDEGSGLGPMVTFRTL